MKNKNMTEQFINDGGFKGYTFIEGGVCAAKGFKAAGVNAQYVMPPLCILKIKSRELLLSLQSVTLRTEGRRR